MKQQIIFFLAIVILACAPLKQTKNSDFQKCLKTNRLYDSINQDIGKRNLNLEKEVKVLKRRIVQLELALIAKKIKD